jgi:hypothetical protein
MDTSTLIFIHAYSRSIYVLLDVFIPVAMRKTQMGAEKGNGVYSVLLTILLVG